MRAALYARVSTHAAQNPQMQIAELRDYCQRRGWEVAGEYVDVGVSGAKERRPQLDRMLVELGVGVGTVLRAAGVGESSSVQTSSREAPVSTSFHFSARVEVYAKFPEIGRVVSQLKHGHPTPKLF